MNRILKLALLSCLFSLIYATPLETGLETYSFDQYLQDFNLQYAGDELLKRKAIFEKELQRVRAHNAKGLPWKENVNKFSVLTEAEKKSSFGRVKMNTKKLNLKGERELPKDFVIKPISQLPKNVDWRTKGVVSTVKDQGHCGSCWAFASTATVESHVAISTGLLFELSVQQMAMCAPNADHCGGTGGCEGSTAELAFDYLSKSAGFYQEYQYGYVSYYGQDYACQLPSQYTNPVATIGGYVKLPDNNYTTLLNAIATVGPIAINVDASTWHAYSSGVFNGCNQASPDVNHVVVLVGYGEDDTTGQKYWLVRNSWNAGWGEKGYIRLLRTDNDDNNCGSDVTPQDGVECAGHDEPVKVCGTCGAIYDSSYPVNARLT